MLRLPEDALIRTSEEVREMLRRDREWTLEHELLAQVKEEVSILAAEHRRKKPVEVPRPDHLSRKKRKRKPVKVGEPNPEGFKHAIGVLVSNAKTVHVR